ncbi:MAG TPA: FAD-dependent oxidoreductase [Firmicutes bacterium]|nr:FAD-dependent oxidoreductase [Bacillota bacterium]
MSRYVRLLEPFRIGKVEIKNRVAMAPMGIGGLATLEAGFSQRAIDYYVERAKGGTGLIITGVVKVENEIEKFHEPLLVPCATYNPAHFIQTAAELTERVRAYGSKIFLQLTAGFGHNAPPMMLAGHPVAPSAIPDYWVPTVTCRELTTDEVETLVRKFGESARIAAMSGFDGIEIHAVHEGYLLDQFTMSFFNRRTDKYGGDLQGRLTFPVEIVKTIKREVGRDFPVILRFSIKSYIKGWNQGGLPGEDFAEQGRDTEEGLRAARILEQAGYDAFDADAGSYEAWYWAHPPIYQEHGLYLPLTEKLKQVVRVPVLVAGRMELPDLAEKTLAEGKAADMVVLGRGLLTDPHWVRKVEADRPERIRPCIGCHDGCLGRIFIGRPLSCAVNPAVGRETIYALDKTNEPKKITVVGGGVAGLEVARTAAIRGHQVVLYEKANALGGHLIEAAVPKFKADLARLLDWYKVELQNLPVQVNTGTEVTPQMVERERADITVIATGSDPVVPQVPGINSDKVMTATDVLLGQKVPAQNVLVIGGGLIGCETALWLAQQGKKVTIVEALGDLMTAGIPVPHPNRTMLIDLLKLNKVEVITDHALFEVLADGGLLVDHNFQRRKQPADSIVLAVGLKPRRTLYDALVGRIPNLYLIGDAREARNVMYAIWDAYEVARAV